MCFGKSFRLHFEIVLLVADLPAKASLLCMSQYNAFFGCTLCTIEAKRVGRIHYYPNAVSSMRNAKEHAKHVQEVQRFTNSESLYGVKGRSALSGLISNLPLTAPIDYMHQVLLGVTKVLLQIAEKKLGPRVIELEHTLKSIKVGSIFFILL